MKISTKYIAAIILLSGNIACNSRMTNVRTSEKLRSTTCSELILEISDVWASDTLGGNGNRLEIYKKLLTCKLDSINEGYILKYLGKPSGIRNYGAEFAFHYTYYDYMHLDHSISKRTAYGYDFLILFFDSSTRKLKRISEGTGEY